MPIVQSKSFVATGCCVINYKHKTSTIIILDSLNKNCHHNLSRVAELMETLCPIFSR